MPMLLFNLIDFGNLLETIKVHVTTWHFWMNLLDVFVVWFLVYKVMLFLRGTKAIQLVRGIAVILIVRILSGWLGLNTISWLMDQVITYGVIAAIIIFQPEIRRALEHLGRGALFKKRKQTNQQSKEEQIIQAYDKAIQYMSKRRIGALIAIARDTSLAEYIETGIPLEADLTSELLINIFIPNTPLHDGSVIVQEDKVLVACAYLPLSERMNIPKEFGTRHRAAVGLSEVSDAVVLVVSEETGGISIAMNGELFPHLEQEQYLKMLRNALENNHQSVKDNHLLTNLFGKKGDK